MMLGTDSEFVNKFFAARKYWDISVGQWTASGGASAVVHMLVKCPVVSPCNHHGHHHASFGMLSVLT